VSAKTITRIKCQREALGEDEAFSTPKQRYKGKRRRIEPDNFDRDAIRRTICDIYEKKEHVTIQKLLICYVCILSHICLFV
jgi:hypothetical protein